MNLPQVSHQAVELTQKWISHAAILLRLGWCGGWIESALQSGMNAACAVAQQLMGESALFPNSPMTQTADLYDYGPYLSENTRTK